MFIHASEYIQGELLATSQDYKLLEKMNKITTQKYKRMTENASEMAEFMGLLQKKYESFKPYLEQIDEIERSIGELEKTVDMLDAYTTRIEGKFKRARVRTKK